MLVAAAADSPPPPADFVVVDDAGVAVVDVNAAHVAEGMTVLVFVAAAVIVAAVMAGLAKIAFAGIVPTFVAVEAIVAVAILKGLFRKAVAANNDDIGPAFHSVVELPWMEIW